MPRLTSDCGSACVATTRLFLTPTVTPHPVPQKRHGAFAHLSSAASASVIAFCACTGIVTKEAVAAAELWMNCLREVPNASTLPIYAIKASSLRRSRNELEHPDDEAV